MTNEDMQKAMSFILEQQAQSSVKIDALAEAQKQAEKRWSRTEDGIRALLSIAEIHERDINALDNKIGTLSETIGTLSETIGKLSETGSAADERLNALINIVERHITEGRNGKP